MWRQWGGTLEPTGLHLYIWIRVKIIYSVYDYLQLIISCFLASILFSRGATAADGQPVNRNEYVLIIIARTCVVTAAGSLQDTRTLRHTHK